MWTQVMSLPKKTKFGRPEDEVRLEAFNKVADYIERNDDEQTTITDLVIKMGDFLQETNLSPYSVSHMKSKMLSHFGGRIEIKEINGKVDVVTFKTTAAAILHEFYCNPKNIDPEEEARRILVTAAKIVKNDRKSIETKKMNYPEFYDMSSVEKAT